MTGRTELLQMERARESLLEGILHLRRVATGVVRRRLRHAGLLCLAAAALPAAAQNAVVAQPGPEFPRYTVELIVFSYDPGARAGDEIFVPEVPAAGAYAEDEDAGVPVFSDRAEEPLSAPPAVTGLEEPLSAPPATGLEEPADTEISGFDDDLADIPLRTRIELTRLPPEQFAMNAIYDKLVALDAYRPIMRAAWTQTTPPQDASPSIRLRALGDPPPGLDGTVTLYQGRFVHLGLDLTFDARAAEAIASGAFGSERSATDRAIAQSGVASGALEGHRPDDRVPAYGDGRFEPGGPVSLPVRYRISEVRIIRDGEMRYYDHPRFGVIAKLTRVKEED